MLGNPNSMHPNQEIKSTSENKRQTKLIFIDKISHYIKCPQILKINPDYHCLHIHYI